MGPERTESKNLFHDEPYRKTERSDHLDDHGPPPFVIGHLP
jgi:hypothetical protein